MMAALETYVRLIPGSSIDWVQGLDAETPSGPPGSVTIAGFTLGDQRYRAIEAGEHHPFNDAFSIMVECEDQATLDRIWEGLLQGGKPQQCGWLIDRWGLRWQIVPKRLAELMDNPDPQKTKRVIEAMLKMVKFDIAALEAAAASD